MSKRELYGDTVDILIDIDVDAKNSESFRVPRWATFVGVYIPSIVDGIISLEVSKDDTTFIPVGDIVDGADFVVCASGSDPIYADISPLIASVPIDWFLRIVSQNTQTATDRTITISFRA